MQSRCQSGEWGGAVAPILGVAHGEPRGDSSKMAGAGASLSTIVAAGDGSCPDQLMELQNRISGISLHLDHR